MTVKLGKKTLITFVIVAILAIMYNVIFFVLPWRVVENSGAFWVTYGFSWAAFLFIGIVTGVAFGKKELKSKIFGIPVFYVGVTIGVFQAVIDAVVMSIGSFYVIKFWIPLIVEVLLFGFGTISVLVRAAYRDHIDNVDTKFEKKKEYIKELRIEVNSLMKENKIQSIDNKLQKLYETIRYADPVSSNAIVELENQISDDFDLLRKAIGNGDETKASNQIDRLFILLEERKLRLKDSRIH